MVQIGELVKCENAMNDEGGLLESSTAQEPLRHIVIAANGDNVILEVCAACRTMSHGTNSVDSRAFAPPFSRVLLSTCKRLIGFVLTGCCGHAKSNMLTLG